MKKILLNFVIASAIIVSSFTQISAANLGVDLENSEGPSVNINHELNSDTEHEMGKIHSLNGGYEIKYKSNFVLTGGSGDKLSPNSLKITVNFPVPFDINSVAEDDERSLLVGISDKDGNYLDSDYFEYEYVNNQIVIVNKKDIVAGSYVVTAYIKIDKDDVNYDLLKDLAKIVFKTDYVVAGATYNDDRKLTYEGYAPDMIGVYINETFNIIEEGSEMFTELEAIEGVGEGLTWYRAKFSLSEMNVPNYIDIEKGRVKTTELLVDNNMDIVEYLIPNEEGEYSGFIGVNGEKRFKDIINVELYNKDTEKYDKVDDFMFTNQGPEEKANAYINFNVEYLEEDESTFIDLILEDVENEMTARKRILNNEVGVVSDVGISTYKLSVATELNIVDVEVYINGKLVPIGTTFEIDIENIYDGIEIDINGVYLPKEYLGYSVELSV